MVCRYPDTGSVDQKHGIRRIGLSEAPGTCLKKSEVVQATLVKHLSDGNKSITDQQIQAVGMGLDVVGGFHGNSPEVLELGTSHLPDNHGKWNHPLDTLLYIAPLIPCQ